MSDQHARTVAVSDFAQTMLVEAGAGTGKTTLLVNRICALIESGVAAEKIAAVTFTVKAAGELKQRLRTKLKEIDSANSKLALQNLDRMTVNTIHGLASEILRTLPVEAKLPPEFLALDELQQSAAVTEFRTDWLMRALDDNLPKSLELADALGLDLLRSEKKGLAKLFDVLNRSQVDLNDVTTGEAEATEIVPLVSAIKLQIDQLAQLALHCKKQDDLLYMIIKELVNWINRIPVHIFSREGINWIAEAKVGSSSSGNKTKWSSQEALEDAREHSAALESTIDELRQLITSLVCNDIIKWLKPAVAEFRQQLRDNGTIGFDDLLILCRDMLRDSKVARDYFKRRYRHVHIDEFQDTDSIQVEILFFLCEAEGAHANKWQEVELTQGKLFVVGDPKQSIYRFRGADVRIYNRVAQIIEAKGKKLNISRNFRSRPSILSEVNEIFAPVMQGKTDDEADYIALEPFEHSQDDPTAVEVLLPPSSYDVGNCNANQSAIFEAVAIAKHIADLKKRVSNFSYSDVAILMRSGTKVAHLQDALSARGIPFISFMNSAFTSRVEIESLITILTSIANPQHTVATIGALRSPWFAISDDELSAYKLAGKSFVYTDVMEADDPVGTVLLKLRKWHARGKHVEPSALIEELISVFPIDIIYGLKSEGVLRVQNIQTVCELVRRLEQSGVMSLSAVVERISDIKRLVQSTELEARDESLDAVQILTLHKSKGLEFRYVYLYNYSEKDRAAGEWLLRKSLDGTPHQLGISGENKFRTRNWDSIKDANKSAENAELQRLLYVGMTRAKDKLVLPLCWSRSGKQPSIPAALKARYQLDELNRPTVTNTGAISTIAEETKKCRFNSLATKPAEARGNPEIDVENYHAWQAALATRIRTLNIVAPHDEEAETEVDWSRVRARKIGTFVHSVLEQSAKGKPLAEAKQLAARSLSVSPDEELEAMEIIQKVLQSNLFTVELQTARRIITELPIIEDQANYVAAKFVDLMFETMNGDWILVDYKTDDIPDEAVNDRKEHHRRQLEEYGQMFARLMGKPPKESRVYFLRPNRMVNL